MKDLCVLVLSWLLAQERIVLVVVDGDRKFVPARGRSLITKDEGFELHWGNGYPPGDPRYQAVELHGRWGREE